MLKIKKLKLNTTEKVYDLSVAGNVNFYANGILVHNSEISLATSEERTAVCCLSSLNLNYWDEWNADPLFIKDVADMLDNALTRFIKDAPDTIKRARFSAMRERSIGVGVLGFHTYLQHNMIPFDSPMAKSFNFKVFKHISDQLHQANISLANTRGACPDSIDGGASVPVRFSHTMAIAPTASTSIIMGNISPSIEPIRANVYRQSTMSGSFLNKNPALQKLVKAKIDAGQHINEDELWTTITNSDGSIQNIDFFTDEEKDVFKTASELDQRWIIELAGDRQKFIDQSQSVNLFFSPTVNVKYLHGIHLMAWKHGLKSLYYCRSDAIRKADKVSQRITRERIETLDLHAIASGEDECLACQ